jgi:hypothetical protein
MSDKKCIQNISQEIVMETENLEDIGIEGRVLLS